MWASFWRLLAVAFVAGLTVNPASAAAPRAEVHDEAHLFGAGALERARQRLREIVEAHDLDVVIETRERLSPKELEKLSRSRANVRKDAHVLAELTRRRAEEMKLDGLLVIYYRVPADVLTLLDGERLHVSVVLEGRSPGVLAPHDVEQVRKAFAGPRPRDWLLRRKASLPDEALLAGVEKLDEALWTSANRGVVDYLTVPIFVGAFLGLWLVLFLVRARVLRTGGGRPLDLSAQRPAMLGALCGVVPAFWMYDRLFRPGVPPMTDEEAAAPLFAPPPPPPAPEPPLREGEERHAEGPEGIQTGAHTY